MSAFALLVIAALVTVLLVKTAKPVPALVAGVVTVCLLFGTFPALGSAVVSGVGTVADQAGAAGDRAADVPAPAKNGDHR